MFMKVMQLLCRPCNGNYMFISIFVSYGKHINWLFACCVIFMLLFSHAAFYSKINSFKTLSECQMVWIQIRTDILFILIWFQTICKGYQQTTKATASKERVFPDYLKESRSFRPWVVSAGSFRPGSIRPYFRVSRFGLFWWVVSAVSRFGRGSFRPV